jgi:hypothetical protein
LDSSVYVIDRARNLEHASRDFSCSPHGDCVTGLDGASAQPVQQLHGLVADRRRKTYVTYTRRIVKVWGGGVGAIRKTGLLLDQQ